MRDEDRAFALGEPLEFRHVGYHDSRIYDAETTVEPKLGSRQRSANAANIPFGPVGKIRQFAVAEAAAHNELSGSHQRQRPIEDSADADQKQLRMNIAETREQKNPKAKD